ncbi:exodeoxyribonuclease V subunit beta [Marinobacter sp. JSM 1782161]|uniref:exodeoxyribonuclease V subunit beta n=1 Tax=Marinobacter sp. JSM 1782161 TaxID=2685906 RepID=UPI001402DBBE|nr:exodeoxyribonuclease V subunit beta [Marinobacter sp. JSM 1782161]
MTDNRLDPLTFPLHGSRLIEASAGTGKTFTIALLYVRAVLGHAPIAEVGHSLTPRDILVVTFTEAATKELRDRIRARLAEAAQLFREDPAGIDATMRANETDPLKRLRNACDDALWASNARLLELAAESMDEAAVHTIHSWCYRMLREHAFDSGGLFHQSLETDHSELQADVVRDYWRTFVNPLSVAGVETYLQQLRTPDDLHDAVRPLLSAPDDGEAVYASPEALIEPAMAERASLFQRARGELSEAIEDFRERFQQAKTAGHINGRQLRADWLEGWLAGLAEWAQADGMALPGVSDKVWEKLTSAGVEACWKKGAPPVDAPLVAIVEALAAEREREIPREALIRHAAQWSRQRLEREKQRRAEMGFDDLLSRLDAALQGQGGERLARAIRQQFPLALIDEFQDTDPVQYRIFDAVYNVADNVAETGFFMIGDPKQAIYAFRGADIHTYLKARLATAGRHYTLARNFRSARAMVEASNRVFEHADATSPRGAFLFRSPDGNNPLPFNPVEAQGRKEDFVVDGESPPALTVWYSDPEGNKADATARSAQACASEIVRLLNLGRDGLAGFRDASGDIQTLAAGDIAVLVNTGREADAVRTALGERQVKSVYLSDRASVLDTVQAQDVLLWLEACAEPERERPVRAALASSTLDLDWAELDRLRQDELAWEAEIERFRTFGRIWQQKGVLAMIRRMLSAFEVPARLLREPNGERALTDVLHIAELLQQASQQVDGEQALIRHFAEMIADPSADADTRQVRLESDADLVQVVTVHKSKGLEYPLVFLPFASAARPVNPSRLPIRWHDERGHIRLTFKPDAEVIAAADEERLGEDIRKLYVALTRARYATWMGAPLLGKETPQSALAVLSGYDGEAGDWGSALQALAGDHAAIRVEAEPEPVDTRYTPPTAPIPGPARVPARQPGEHWWIASYSAIRYQQPSTLEPETEFSAPGPEPETADAERLAEERDLALAGWRPLRQPSASERRLHRFYRGAGPGTFLHGLLEWAADSGFSSVVNEPEALQEMLVRRCDIRGCGPWAQPLGHWLTDLVQANLPLPVQPDGSQGTLTLTDEPLMVPEMEFWMASRDLDIPRLDALVRQHTLDGRSRPQASPMTVNGMLKGFIDLVFEHGGRYYVADYKSNFIGTRDEDYHEGALAEVIAEHRYDLQFCLYLLALHRLLRSRLSDYDYDAHIGGAVYMFLRGNGAESRGVYSERPPKALIEALDRLFRGETLNKETADSL